MCEGCVAKVDRESIAAHTLVHDFCRAGLAAVLDGDCLATVGVSVRLGTHELMGEGYYWLVFGALPSASTHADTRIVVGDITRARRGCRA